MAAINKRIFLLFPVLLFAFVSSEGVCGTIRTTVTSHVTVLSTGQTNIQYVIKNTGDDTAHHVSVATFLALEAQKSDSLGSNPPGGVIRYDCVLTPPDLKPGNYTLVTRISFDEHGGTAHRAYHFSPLPWRLDQVKDARPALSVEMSEPSFNTKSFWQPGGKVKLVLKNGSSSAIQPVVTFYLPDGFMIQEPERSYQLAAGERKEEMIPLTMDASVKETRSFQVVAWYELNGAHHSQLIEGKIKVEEKPIYFKVFLILGGAILVGFVIRMLRRKKSGAKA